MGVVCVCVCMSMYVACIYMWSLCGVCVWFICRVCVWCVICAVYCDVYMWCMGVVCVVCFVSNGVLAHAEAFGGQKLTSDSLPQLFPCHFLMKGLLLNLHLAIFD